VLGFRFVGNGKSPVPPSRAGPIFDPPEDVPAKECLRSEGLNAQKALRKIAHGAGHFAKNSGKELAEMS